MVIIHSLGDSNYANSVNGIDRVLERVQSLRPNILWENCEDGGNLETYKMMRYYHMTNSVYNTHNYGNTTRYIWCFLSFST